MAMMNPEGRINFEPNSATGPAGGPRESHDIGFRSFAAQEEGPKVRERSETFADHYSQARQFYISQTNIEQGHIADALIFELSKVENPAIRLRLVSHLPNIDGGLAERVATGLGIQEKIKPAKPAVAPRTDLKPSKALSILLNPPKTFAGRKVGILVTDGVSRSLLDALRKEVVAQEATVEIVAPTVGGVKADDGSRIPADQKIGGGPSVLYDAIALLPSEQGAAALMKNGAAADFVSDAFGHLKFIAWVSAALPLFKKVGIAEDLDEGFIELASPKSVKLFLNACRDLRYWKREETVKF